MLLVAFQKLELGKWCWNDFIFISNLKFPNNLLIIDSWYDLVLYSLSVLTVQFIIINFKIFSYCMLFFPTWPVNHKAFFCLLKGKVKCLLEIMWKSYLSFVIIMLCFLNSLWLVEIFVLIQGICFDYNKQLLGLYFFLKKKKKTFLEILDL